MTTSRRAAWPNTAEPKRRRARGAAVFMVALSSVIALSPSAGAAPSKIVVDGQDITANPTSSPICDDQENGFHINGNGLFAVLSSDKTQVQDLDLMSLSKQWGWAPGRKGNVQLAQSGNTYSFTGSIAPSVQGWPSGDPVPFEADVTCS
jgi:Mycobacterium 19 kDa lipoprotein antigen